MSTKSVLSCASAETHGSVKERVPVEVIDHHRVADPGEGRRGAALGFGAAFFQDLEHFGFPLLPVRTALPDRAKLFLHHAVQEFLHGDVAEAAALIVFFQFVEVRVVREVLGELFVPAEGVEVGEDGVAFHMARITLLKMGRVGVHRHDLLPDGFLVVREVDAVAERLAHLGFAIDARKAEAGAVGWQHDLRLHQCLAVDFVEFPDDLAALLEHRLLVLAHRHGGRPEGRDVRRLADRVAEEAHRDAGLEVPLLDLRLDGRIALDAGHRDEVHVVEGQLGQFRHHGLDEDAGFFRVDADREVVQRDLKDVLPYLLRMLGVVGERLGVRDHDVDLVVLAGILKDDPLFQGSDVVAYVQAAGRPVARQDDLSHFLLLFSSSVSACCSAPPVRPIVPGAGCLSHLIRRGPPAHRSAVRSFPSRGRGP